MIYQYKCETCGFIADYDYDINYNRPKRKKCSECGMITMYRIFGNAIHVPFQWTKDSFDFTKRPRMNKKYR